MSYKIGVLTISDSSFRKEREDISGKTIINLLTKDGLAADKTAIVPDEADMISETLLLWCADGMNLILTTGGTGLYSRDVTPEATRRIMEREVPGIAEAIRMEGLKETPMAMLSRGLAGVRGSTLIINMPGSPKAVQSAMKVILPVIRHAMDKLQGDATPCHIKR
ncbi:MAG: MogA/MoaB family molybdenum cofactor biosynthesis protein [Dissulfuribacterales bacterium]